MWVWDASVLLTTSSSLPQCILSSRIEVIIQTLKDYFAVGQKGISVPILGSPFGLSFGWALVFSEMHCTTFCFPPVIRANLCDLNSVPSWMGSVGNGHCVFLVTQRPPPSDLQIRRLIEISVYILISTSNVS